MHCDLQHHHCHRHHKKVYVHMIAGRIHLHYYVGHIRCGRGEEEVLHTSAAAAAGGGGVVLLLYLHSNSLSQHPRLHSLHHNARCCYCCCCCNEDVRCFVHERVAARMCLVHRHPMQHVGIESATSVDILHRVSRGRG